MARYFTLREAQEILPEVAGRIARAMVQKREIDAASAILAQAAHRVALLGGVLVDQQALAGERLRHDRAAARLRFLLEQIEALGAQVKDLDIGLIDFPSRFRGQDVCLCWKAGEPAIGYWHGAEEGYRGRKPIDDDFLRGHEGDS